MAAQPVSTPARTWPAQSVSAGLPDFPWTVLEPVKARASAHPDGLVDLSVGSPVDPVPAAVQEALAAAARTGGYPTTAGSLALREAAGAYLHRLSGAEVPPDAVLPTIGAKELVAWLPTQLGLGHDDIVVIPTVCYPTYEVGARLAGAQVVRSDVPRPDLAGRVGLVWVNSPGNPHGRVLSDQQLAQMLAWTRECGAVLASDECYLELGWEREPVSALAPHVCQGSLDGLLAVHSLSKRSNLAGYRAGYVAGDPRLVAELLEVRRHAGMMVPAPVQAAMLAALGDQEHVREQKARYRARREVLRAALTAAGFKIEYSEAGLYLWASYGLDSWSTVDWLAERGILASAGVFYGPGGDGYVRLALTATDERIAAAAARLTSR